jgi:hypothetical protein
MGQNPLAVILAPCHCERSEAILVLLEIASSLTLLATPDFDLLSLFSGNGAMPAQAGIQVNSASELGARCN